VSREYLKDGMQLGLFIAYYAHQRSGGYMHSPKVCLPSSGWEIEEPGSIQVDSPDGKVPINRYVISKSGEKSLILYWYESSDRILADEYRTKLYLIHDGLLYGRAAGSVVRIQLPINARAESDAIPFATELMADVRRVFGK
jgi:EpsI family protein